MSTDPESVAGLHLQIEYLRAEVAHEQRQRAAAPGRFALAIKTLNDELATERALREKADAEVLRLGGALAESQRAVELLSRNRVVQAPPPTAQRSVADLSIREIGERSAVRRIITDEAERDAAFEERDRARAVASRDLNPGCLLEIK